MDLFSNRMRAIVRGLGLAGVGTAVLLLAVQAAALAAYDPQKGGNPYYYGGYPGPPVWFWILVFPGFLAAIVFLPFANWLKNSYRDANANLRNRNS